VDALRAKQRQQEEEEKRANFLACLAHEMRNPLFQIYGLCEHLLSARKGEGESGAISEASMVRDLQLLHLIADGMISKISANLEYDKSTRIAAVATKPVNLAFFVARLSALCSPLARMKDITVDVRYAAEQGTCAKSTPSSPFSLLFFTPGGLALLCVRLITAFHFPRTFR